VRIRGVVVDENAQRVAGATVLASRGDGEPCVITKTGDDGWFTLEIEPDGEGGTTIRAYANGGSSGVTYQHDGEPGGSALSIEIAPTVVVCGHVTDEAGRPVHGALVATGGGVRTTTDAGGGYRLTGLRPGKVNLHAWQNGMQLQTAAVLVGDGTRLDWQLLPASGRWIRFTLTKETPAEIRPTWWLRIHHPIHLHLEGTFPDSREVTLGGLPTDYELQGGVWSTGLRADPVNHFLDVDPRNGIVEWRTHLSPPTKETVSGIVVDERGQPLPAVGVSVRGAFLVHDATCTTDAEGRFVCELARGASRPFMDSIVFSLVDKERVLDDHDGEAWINPRCRGEAHRSSWSDGEIVLRTVPAAGVRGRVVRRGSALSGALVTLMLQWTLRDKRNTSRLASTETDEEGRFRFCGLNAAIGEGLFVRVQAPGVDLLSGGFSLREGATLTLPELQAEALASVGGRFLDATGDALRGWFLSLLEVDGRLDTWGMQEAQSDAEGRFVIHNVRPGRYALEVRSDPYDPRSPSTVVASNIDVRSGEAKSLGDVTR